MILGYSLSDSEFIQIPLDYSSEKIQFPIRFESFETHKSY